MGTYKLEYGGKKEVVKGVNLATAVRSLGFTVRDIEPNWYRKSNGKYTVICQDGMMIHCTWLEKVEQLKQQLC